MVPHYLSVLLDCSTVSSEECVAVEDDNVVTAPMMADKDILEFVQSSKSIIDTIDSDHKNEMTNVAPGPMSSDMKSIMQRMRSSIGEMSNKMERFVVNFMLKKDNVKKHIRLFSKSINVLFFQELESFELIFMRTHGHGTTPLSVKGDIEDVSSELNNGGYRLHFLDETSRTLLLSAS
ncbi:hypothetical protein TNCV_830871 [Trichonephila clavipes]|nr:hypothetical protein TNCV_830871 [Trichonephila clavipes]